MTNVFTDKYIKSLKPAGKPYKRMENGSDRGFGVQVSPGGTKTFIFAYKIDGNRRYYPLGKYPMTGKPGTALADARQACRDARILLDKGIDPKANKKAEEEKRKLAEQEDGRRRREAEMKGSVKQLFDTYAGAMEQEGKPSHKQVRHIYSHDIEPVLGADTKANEVQPHHVKQILHRVIERGAMTKANRVHQYMRAAFRFGIEHDNDPKNMKSDVLFFLEHNPVRDVPKPLKREAVGERELSTEEIKELWNRLDGGYIHPLTVGVLKLMLATGQRLGEILHAEWSEFDFEGMKWELPAGKTKNGRPHVVPITPFHQALLDQIRPYSDKIWLFPKRKKSVSEESNPRNIDSISQAVARFCNPGPKSKKKPFPKFVPRDLRRTWKTRTGEIGLSKEIRDRLQNHALNDVSSKNYDRYDYLPQKRKAMDAWSAWLEITVQGDIDNVIELRK